jgi:hypothetical protein
MQFDRLRRREFITPIGGAAAWPLAAHAQQAGMRRVGLLMPNRPSDGDIQARIRTLHQELQRLGWIKGVNIQFDERWTTDDMELVRAHAINLVELNPDVLRHLMAPNSAYLFKSLTGHRARAPKETAARPRPAPHGVRARWARPFCKQRGPRPEPLESSPKVGCSSDFRSTTLSSMVMEREFRPVPT